MPRDELTVSFIYRLLMAHYEIKERHKSLFISTPEGTLGVQAKEHPDPGVCGRGGLPDVHLEEVVTRHPQDLEHRVVTNPPENERSQLAEAAENPLEDVGFLDGDVVGFEHFYFEALSRVPVRSSQVVEKIEDCQAVL